MNFLPCRFKTAASHAGHRGGKRAKPADLLIGLKGEKAGERLTQFRGSLWVLRSYTPVQEEDQEKSRQKSM